MPNETLKVGDRVRHKDRGTIGRLVMLFADIPVNWVVELEDGSLDLWFEGNTALDAQSEPEKPSEAPGLSDERLAEIEARAAKATPGPWVVAEKSGQDTIWLDVETVYGEEEILSSSLYIGQRDDSTHFEGRANVEFVAHARTDIPDLLAEVTRLKSELAALKEPR